MKKRNLRIIILVCVLVLVSICIAVCLREDKSEQNQSTEEVTQSVIVTTNDTEYSSSIEETTSEQETSSIEETTTEEETESELQTETLEVTTQQETTTVAPTTVAPTTIAPPTVPPTTAPVIIIPPVTEPAIQPITFPYVIPGTNLIIQNIGSYSGIFLEDGSDRDVDNISSIVIKNNGTKPVEYASVFLKCNDTPLEYIISCLPAGGVIVVQEANATTYTEGIYTECTATVAELETFEMSYDSLQVTEAEDHSLMITNLTNKTIPSVRIFYKFYMEDENAYVGGITYTAKVNGLEAGASMTVTPSHYVIGSSRLVMVRTYDIEQ